MRRMDGDEEEMLRMAAEIVQLLASRQIKLLCIDFDATFLRIHTSGRWEFSAVELCAYVRPLFQVLIRLACEAGIHVAIVTFSPQLVLIREVLQILFGTGIAQHVIVRANDAGSWMVTASDVGSFLPLWQSHRSPYPFDRSCKLPFVISASMEASRWRGECIQHTHALLIDDDPQNVRIANDHGITSIYFDPEETTMQKLWIHMQRLHQATAPAPPPPVRTPSKDKSCSRIPLALMATPENFKHACSAPSTIVTSTPASAPRKTRFGGPKTSMCTPSPVMKLKYTCDMGRPKSKKFTKQLRQCTRNIDEDLDELHELSGTNIMF